MNKQNVHGSHMAFLEAETITTQSDASIQSDRPDYIVVIDSDPGATTNSGAEEDIGLFRPRLHWVSEK